MTMTSTVRVFEYMKPDSGGPEMRVVYVVNEDDTYIQGIDFRYLGPGERTRVQLLMSGHQVGVPHFGKDQCDSLDPAWTCAFRCFRKDRITRE